MREAIIPKINNQKIKEYISIIMTPMETSYQNVVDRLKQLKKRDLRINLLFGFTFTFFVMAACLALILIVDAVFPLIVPIRLAWWGLTIFVMLLSITIYLILPLVKRQTLETVALRVENHFPKLENSLINCLQLWRLNQRNEMGYSPQLVELGIKNASQKSASFDFFQIINTKPLRKYSQFLIFLGAFLSLFSFIFPAQFANTAKLLANPLTPLPTGPQLEITVYPGNVELIKGQSLTVEVATENVTPKNIQVIYGRAAEGLNSIKTLNPIAKMRYSYQFKDIDRSFYYQVQADEAVSPVYQVKVTEKPMITNLTLEYFYPKYTGIPSKITEENNGDITAIKGTKVSIQAQSNNALKSANLILSTGDTIPMRLIHPKVVKSELFVTEDFTYHIDLVDYLGSTNDNPIEYKVRSLSDEYPVVNIIEPGEDTDLAEDMLLYMTISVLDDYGIKTINLKYKKGSDGEEKLINISDFSGQTEITHDYTWNLTELNLLPEDVVIYYVEVYDTDTVSGPKRSTSSTYTIRFPSIYEIYEEVEEEQEAQITDMEEVLEKSREIEENLEEVQRELLKNPEMTWEQRKEVEASIQKQKEMLKQVQEAAEKMDKTIEKMERNEAVSLETLEKMQEVQKLMEEISTDEMKEAMEKLQEAMEQLNPEEVQKAMQNMDMNMEEYLQKLERTLGLLQQIKMEQQMEAAVQKAEELVRRQDELNRSTENAEKQDDKDKLNELSKDQDSLKEDAESLKKDLDELSKMMKDNEMKDLAQKMDELSQSLNQDQIPQNMQQSSEDMKQGDFQKSQKSQQETMHQLLKLTEGLKNMQMQMQQAGMEEVLAEIQKAIADILYISDSQENLVNSIQENQSREYDQFFDLSDDQLILSDGTKRVADDIYEISKKSFAIKPNVAAYLGRALSQMDNTQENLENRQGNQAQKNAGKAVTSLNKTVMGLMQSQKQCQQQGQQGQGGMQQLMQQLQQMAQQQQGINEGTQGMMQQMMGQQGQGLSMEARSQMARLAGEQEMVRKNLEKLAQEAAENANQIGRLDEMAKEAGEVAKELEKNNVNDDVIRRQQRIMTRLLDAQRSLRKQDYSRKRKSKVGQDYARKPPKPLPSNLGNKNTSLREDLLRAMKEGYPMEYENLIKAYFRALSGEE